MQYRGLCPSSTATTASAASRSHPAARQFANPLHAELVAIQPDHAFARITERQIADIVQQRRDQLGVIAGREVCDHRR
ncbi:hypothetical protein [Nocardia carnea]|uniref:hypothetical protein n=1 Tax=Nocardia carnea TaxID=37328 RepID=UPI002454F70B|nr:hypothetical protein [Nocardia carnea]